MGSLAFMRSAGDPRPACLAANPAAALLTLVTYVISSAFSAQPPVVSWAAIDCLAWVEYRRSSSGRLAGDLPSSASPGFGENNLGGRWLVSICIKPRCAVPPGGQHWFRPAR